MDEEGINLLAELCSVTRRYQEVFSVSVVMCEGVYVCRGGGPCHLIQLIISPRRAETTIAIVCTVLSNFSIKYPKLCNCFCLSVSQSVCPRNIGKCFKQVSQGNSLRKQ